jgi:multisubunit Na+/H+ antiporter MnhB subunit
VPLMTWGGPVGLAILMPAFIAFTVMLGLQWSIRSKGTIGSIVAAVMVLLVIVMVLGLCGAAGRQVPMVGPFISATSPINLVFAALRPERVFGSSLAQIDGMLVLGALVAGVIYALIVYGMHQSMKQSFMMTVRRLAGTR